MVLTTRSRSKGPSTNISPTTTTAEEAPLTTDNGSVLLSSSLPPHRRRKFGIALSVMLIFTVYVLLEVPKKIEQHISMPRGLEKRPTLYSCAHRQFLEPFAKDLFPEYAIEYLPESDPSNHSVDDMIITLVPWDCNNQVVAKYNDPFPDGSRITDLRTGREEPFDFPGKILYVSGEGHMDPRTSPLDYHVGYLGDSPTSTELFYVVLLVFYGQFRPFQDLIFGKSRELPKVEKEYFLLYAASHCVDYRDAAFDALSHVDVVHYGGKCRGISTTDEEGEIERKSVQKSPLTEAFNTKHWENFNMMKPYKFSLVMESMGTQEGYISEKIMMAFVAGSVPVYYGTREVFKIFNHKAFVFYDVENPTEALTRIAYLNHNQTAYEEVLKEPILAVGGGNYFALKDNIHDGALKKKIRTMMGLRESPSLSFSPVSAEKN